VFLAIFILIGSYFLIKSFAATTSNLAYGDLNGDGSVNITDLSILLSNYNTANALADINSDGSVNVFDLSILLSHYGTSVPASGWTTVINDQFDSGSVPAHWHLYDGPYGSNTHNCAVPSHATVSGGYMHMLLKYETSGQCGASWYSAGMSSDSTMASVDQRVTVRWRIVSLGGVTSHRIIPMRFPSGNEPWPSGGEEDLCEGGGLAGCSAYFHYGVSSPGQQVCLPSNCSDWSVDLTQWHTMRFLRQNHIITAWIDDLNNPIASYAGNSTTLPDTFKNVILQQECSGLGCPSGTAGSEDIQIDWIIVENPS
jgi:hypothetical protein